MSNSWENETASWLSLPEPTKWRSFADYCSHRIGTLLDWAYLWYNGEAILIADHHNNKNVQFHWDMPPAHKISVYNPGLLKITRMLWAIMKGSSLALADGEWFRKITHIEALNEWYIREVQYPNAFAYIWYQSAIESLPFAEHVVIPTDSSVFQVTKKWVRDILLLVNESYRGKWRPPFLWWGGTFRKKVPAEV